MGSRARSPSFHELSDAVLDEISDKSWAELSEDCNESFHSVSEAPVEEPARRSTRKPSGPNRSSTKPNFQRAMLHEQGDGPSIRRSARVAYKLKEQQEERESLSRKRCRSNTSERDRELSTPGLAGSGTPSRKIHKDDSRASRPMDSTQSTPSGPPKVKVREHWSEPKLGWCTDVRTLERRNKEIQRAKDKDVYDRYLKDVPKENRVPHVHPRTPNKFLNYSRRSWDQMVRTWKKSLYEWAGEEPSASVAASTCSSDVESVNGDVPDEPVKAKLSVSMLEYEELMSCERPDSDVMASLLGCFDIDSQMTADASTLKASDPRNSVKGPTDFSKL